MMVAASQIEQPMRMTEAEYLQFEENSDTKHEFVNGEIIAMTGASWKHGAICTNLSIAIGRQLINKDCMLFAGDLRLKVVSTVSYRYPDVMVICGEPEFVDKRVDTISNPILIIEVQSPSTELIDRNPKLREYRQLDTVQEYLLVTQNEARIERFLRQDTDSWLYTETVGLENNIALPSIGCVIALSDVYNKLTLDSDSEEST
ncbi:MAG: Uma2 family endonuclease [Anaerolineae bacterium]|nr:Uma2 family endonuclease [Anaerolineae bacterium]